MNDNECVRKINAVTEKIFILPASSFCAGGEEGHDACQVINQKMALEKNMSINQKNMSINPKNMSIGHRIHDFFSTFGT